ncbi:ribosomal protein S18-alanine N-acetyltransferase [Aquincola sp. MAHUQ-54]|uniref:[Ribosomal protein bS18]-alanine N-acetyltransferase n=1 Tax=Aquincola agrisoli TaxID=3119538 RepID=A0AAW9QHW9_9BURK
MSALLQAVPPPPWRRSPMTLSMLDAVLAVEQAAYPFPWSRGNFIDSLAAGYAASVLCAADGALIAYDVAMRGVDEMHLLNLTVAPCWQRQGHGRTLLDALAADARAAGLSRLLLEVRTSNEPARLLYEKTGFRHIGLRRGYYPAPGGQREDALVMALDLGAFDALE